MNLFNKTIKRNNKNSATATSTKRRLGSYPASSMTTLEISRTFCTRCLTSPSTPRASVVARCSLAPTAPRGRGLGSDCGAAAGLSIAIVSDIDLGAGSIAIVSDIEAGGGPVSGASSGAVVLFVVISGANRADAGCSPSPNSLPHCGQKRARSRIDTPQNRQRREISGLVMRGK